MKLSQAGIKKGSDVSVLPENSENRIAAFLPKILLIFALTLFSFSIIPKNIFAQGGSSFYNPQDEKYLLLGLKRAKENYEFAGKEFERNKVQGEGCKVQGASAYVTPRRDFGATRGKGKRSPVGAGLVSARTVFIICLKYFSYNRGLIF